MKYELQVFFTAVMFYTRIPCPSWVDHSEEFLNKATRYFPLIGWIVGGMAVMIIYSLHFIFPPAIVVVLALVASVLITGAFHEDGFSDVCDGFGGGWTTEKILTIMKDSRVGAYGVVGTLLIFALQILTLTELLTFNATFCLKAVLLAHVGSRFTAVTMMRTHNYAREDASSKIKPLAKQLSLPDFLISALWLFPAFLLFQSWWILLVCIPLYLVKIYLARYFQKWIGGYTGDCLGALQQVAFVVILLFCVGICKYI
ncbi:adenosylcobinamide-GDP ribazoletransferase [Pedobacter sp. CG_S7]|uniref:adenosylcobinamide-GDP ribazoletransferase n=1 Tax=Pedobacter sp. CG_S7 TaxID=3143930 RepID=UPI00339673E9